MKFGNMGYGVLGRSVEDAVKQSLDADSTAIFTMSERSDRRMKIGIIGYGNLGRGVEDAVKQSSDAELVAVFTRRDTASITLRTAGAKVYPYRCMIDFVGKIDVMILCGGSARDLPEQTPDAVRYFNAVDSFDTHAKINEHFARVDAVAQENGHVAIISCGWDPGLFSIHRVLSSAVLPVGRAYTFWGKGVSQGHSDAIRRIEGVADARQYTVPVEAALARVRAGESPEFTARDKHTRECFVVARDGADRVRIEREIKTMPDYFADYDTTVHFISAEEMKRDHSGIPHGGRVIAGGKTGWHNEYNNLMEFSIRLDSNPGFTSSVLLSYARAAHRLSARGETGARTVLDIAPALLSPLDAATLRKEML